MLRRFIAACALSVSLSGCFTVIGTGVGAGVAASKNSSYEVQSGQTTRTSYAKSMGLGAAIGFALDALVIGMALKNGDGSFGH